MTLGKNIGRTDTDDQIKNIKYIKSMIAEQEKQAQSLNTAVSEKCTEMAVYLSDC